ncbi:hypothetical protein V6N11_034074 [Hibiscus sabdariffa]|uniref:Uncharacterized protein n=1 Tax=Hibiscus sabdariffa TaxID=183260 RepID=A0ABR2S1F4_9ROSI
MLAADKENFTKKNRGLNVVNQRPKRIAERSLGGKKYPRSPIRKSEDEARVEQGEDESFSSSDREENWSKVERVFSPELVLKKTTIKEVCIIEADSRQADF